MERIIHLNITQDITHGTTIIFYLCYLDNRSLVH